MQYYFCREVAVCKRSIIKQYSLTTRRYLGPTSMDTEMAFLMCNQAQVRSPLTGPLAGALKPARLPCPEILFFNSISF